MPACSHRDGATPPDLTHSDPNFPFAVPDPRAGSFAGLQIIARDDRGQPSGFVCVPQLGLSCE
jgi:hypothetical protein